MNLFNFFITEAHAAPAATPSAGTGYESIIMLVAMGAIFYFLLIRPQSKRAKAHKQLIESLSIGDPVVTAGGVHGKIVALQDAVVTVEIAAGVKVKFNRSSIVGGQKSTDEPTAQI
jgi:preprotein translocase subunit YajC